MRRIIDNTAQYMSRICKNRAHSESESPELSISSMAFEGIRCQVVVLRESGFEGIEAGWHLIPILSLLSFRGYTIDSYLDLAAHIRINLRSKQAQKGLLEVALRIG